MEEEKQTTSSIKITINSENVLKTIKSLEKSGSSFSRYQERKEFSCKPGIKRNKNMSSKPKTYVKNNREGK